METMLVILPLIFVFLGGLVAWKWWVLIKKWKKQFDLKQGVDYAV